MPRFITRIVALVLIACFIADPALASAFQNPLSPTWERASEARVRGNTFDRQALMLPVAAETQNDAHARLSQMFRARSAQMIDPKKHSTPATAPNNPIQSSPATIANLLKKATKNQPSVSVSKGMQLLAQRTNKPILYLPTIRIKPRDLPYSTTPRPRVPGGIPASYSMTLAEELINVLSAAKEEVQREACNDLARHDPQLFQTFSTAFEHFTLNRPGLRLLKISQEIRTSHSASATPAGPRILIPTPLRQYTNQRKWVPAIGSTIEEALRAVGREYPGFGRALFNDEGKLRTFVELYVRDLNGTQTMIPSDPKSPLHSNDHVEVIAAARGGSGSANTYAASIKPSTASRLQRLFGVAFLVALSLLHPVWGQFEQEQESAEHFAQRQLDYLELNILGRLQSPDRDIQESGLAEIAKVHDPRVWKQLEADLITYISNPGVDPKLQEKAEELLAKNAPESGPIWKSFNQLVELTMADLALGRSSDIRVHQRQIDHLANVLKQKDPQRYREWQLREEPNFQQAIKTYKSHKLYCLLDWIGLSVIFVAVLVLWVRFKILRSPHPPAAFTEKNVVASKSNRAA